MQPREEVTSPCLVHERSTPPHICLKGRCPVPRLRVQQCAQLSIHRNRAILNLIRIYIIILLEAEIFSNTILNDKVGNIILLI